MNRPVWQRWWFYAVAFVICAGLLAWLLPGRKADLILADGRAVSLAATTYGTRHTYEEGSFLARVVARLFGANRGEQFGYRSHSFSSVNPSLTVWTEWPKAGSNSPPRYASIRAAGTFESEPLYLAASSFRSSTQRSLVAWKFENYPRRAGKLEIRFHDRPPPYRPNPIGSLAIPNRSEQSSVSFGGKLPPVSVEEGGVTFALKSLESGHELPRWRRGMESGLAPWTMATFEVHESGVLSTNWTVRRIEGLGATSNAFVVAYTRLARRDGSLGAGFSNVLWPDEPDWKLTAEFVRTAGYAEADLWTFRGVPVSRTNSTFATNFIAALHGSVATELTLKPAALQSAAENGYLRTTDLELSFKCSLPEMRVELARVMDNHGRELKFGNGYALWPHTGPNGRYTAGLELAPDTASIDVTIAFQRPRLVTFTVKPTFVRSNFDSAFPPAGK
jgi:hypothetical protein